MSNLINISLKDKIKEIFRKRGKKHYIIKGDKNRIIFRNPKSLKGFRIEIYGHGNIIDIQTTGYFKAKIFIGSPDCFVENCHVVIENNATSNGVMIRLLESASAVTIGEDSMLSDKIEIYCSDTHSIFNNVGEIVNIGHYVNIGNHVWIGTGVNIAKNSIIGDNCIVGMKSVVAGKFEEPNCVIAGNPARVVKKDIRWERERPNIVMHNTEKRTTDENC